MSDDSFQRWQKITIEQFGYAVNLILAFTVAGLGYWFALLRDTEFVPTSTAKYMMLLALIALSFSGGCGLFCVVNRLRDFRGTAQRARDESSPNASTKAYLNRLGERTWLLFYSQLIAFGLGIILLATALLLTDGGKLAEFSEVDRNHGNTGAALGASPIAHILSTAGQ